MDAEELKLEKVSPDFSFVRDGVPIEACLRELIADDPAVRHAAGERLQAMQLGLPSAHTDLKTVDLSTWGPSLFAHRDHFDDAIRIAVASPSFDRADFARRLCAFKIALKEDWSRRVDVSMDRTHAHDAKFDRIAGPAVEAIKVAGDDAAARDKALHRFARIVRAYVCSSCADIGTADSPFEGAESTAPAGAMAFSVFRALGSELLAAPEGLQALLDDQATAHEALSALERAGPAAIAFVPCLLAQLDALAEPRTSSERSTFFGADLALGAIARDDPVTVDALIARLDYIDDRVRTAAASCLRAMDGNLAGRNSSVVERLMRRPRTPDADWPDVMTLASAGRDDPAVRAIVADELRARPPLMVAETGYPEYTYDRIMHRRGAAIDATAYLTAFPDTFIPLLIDALDTFEEFDSDETYRGPCARVSDALARFGPAAAAAALPLASRLGTPEDNELSRAILDALAAIGPAALSTLPLLDAYRRANASGNEPLPDLDAGPIDPSEDPIGAAMQKIRAST